MAYNNKNMQSSDVLNYYLTMNINNICRICLERNPKLMPIFDPIKPPHFSILIMACASVQVLEDDGLPPYICQKCISKLNIAFQFKTQCESSDAKLRQCFQNFHNLPSAPDLTGFIDVKKDGEHLVTFPENTNNNTNQLEQVQVNEHIQETNDSLEQPQLQPLQNVNIEPTTSLHDLDKNTLTELKIEFTDLKHPDIDLKVEDLALIGLNQPKSAKKPTKQHQCDTCGKVFRTKPGLIHHIRIHTGERPYVCHLCDKRFINGGHLHTHMRTHTGEKNHICAACTKAFATAQQLTKHTIAIHTSERPYGCTYCPKRFASSSNLNTHTKIHTGEKNYRCDQCGKAFSTKGQLYQHMLVHTGEKAFLCEYCNKRFSQKAHLIRHLKTHKNQFMIWLKLQQRGGSRKSFALTANITSKMASLEDLKFYPQNQLNYYYDTNSSTICRICLERFQNNKKMCNIFEGNEPIFNMIMSCASVQILQGDGLPNTICQKCLSKLNVAWQFKLQCESSDLRLRQFYTDSTILPLGFPETEKNNVGFEPPEPSPDKTPEIKKQPPSGKKRPKESKIHQCETCGKIFNRREYLTQHIRIHTGEKPYCCHICEKRFINSGHLTTHMRTHTGERPHACSLCPKAFSTRQELHKHTMVHNGERPFVCTTCGKCFGSSSNLYSHLRHHTGEKNFTCEHCGKAFYTKQELKQHLVIHTGEKAFACKFCNKRFSQSAHLRRHLKLHA
ncbi:zinc finger protein 665-like [Tribolium madens]|uniref:zinc finger protein 665-like n=1 Tax=Tribolium madens TaxID=41895 RepID=UPI001CF73C84|nr:zinc finger protein 665-like [Tribolium madens]